MHSDCNLNGCIFLLLLTGCSHNYCSTPVFPNKLRLQSPQVNAYVQKAVRNGGSGMFSRKMHRPQDARFRHQLRIIQYMPIAIYQLNLLHIFLTFSHMCSTLSVSFVYAESFQVVGATSSPNSKHIIALSILGFSVSILGT